MTTATNTNKATEEILRKFEQAEREEGQPAWVYPFRKAGIARFAELGFPTLKDEDWRFTNVAPIASLPFNPSSGSAETNLTQDTVSSFTLGSLPAHRLVFVNGHESGSFYQVEAFSFSVVSIPQLYVPFFAIESHCVFAGKYHVALLKFHDGAFALTIHIDSLIDKCIW